MNSRLHTLLHTVGVDPHQIEDAADAWRRMYEMYGPWVTVVDRYAIEAHVLGVTQEELPDEVRTRLGDEVLAIQFTGIEVIGETRRDPVEIVAYDSGWPERFQLWRDRLGTGLGDAAVTVHHFGSTAVPGLAAKPIVDIQVGVRVIEDESAYVPAIENTGVVLQSREPLHRYFRPQDEQPRDVHIHVYEAGGQLIVDNLLFRDFLRSFPAFCNSYAALKLKLAQLHRNDRLAYTDSKAAFIQETLAKARRWAEVVGWETGTE